MLIPLHTDNLSNWSRANSSKDQNAQKLYRGQMATTSDELQFNEALCARVHRIRNERGWTSEQMATALGIPSERYRKYEYRSPLPSYLIERFALINNLSIAYVLTGKNESYTHGPQEIAKIRAQK
jgi:DNA-binding transcriptional regulator YiaG